MAGKGAPSKHENLWHELLHIYQRNFAGAAMYVNLALCIYCEKLYCLDCKIVERCNGNNCSTSYEESSSCEDCKIVKSW